LLTQPFFLKRHLLTKTKIMKRSQIILLLMMLLLASCNDKDDTSGTALIGTWEIKEFMSLESVLYAKDNAYSPVIQFRSDGTYTLQLDRNGCSGSFEFGADDAISISAAICTEICCDSDFSVKAATMLAQVESYVVKRDDLELHVSSWGWLVLKEVSD
jgi:hypothetical protein